VAKVDIATVAQTPARVLPSSAGLRGLAAIFFLLACPQLFSQEFHPTESQVEAAYLYNFGKFVTWPATRAANSDTFQICVLGKDPFGPALDTIVSGESLGGKKIEVLRLASIQRTQSCMILFISSSEESQLPAIFIAAKTFNLLTVSNIGHFAERGGDIGLVREQDRVRFEVNRSATDEAHLQLSSELLKVAVRVIRKH
jgi:hypothetical protein